MIPEVTSYRKQRHRGSDIIEKVMSYAGCMTGDMTGYNHDMSYLHVCHIFCHIMRSREMSQCIKAMRQNWTNQKTVAMWQELDQPGFGIETENRSFELRQRQSRRDESLLQHYGTPGKMMGSDTRAQEPTSHQLRRRRAG